MIFVASAFLLGLSYAASQKADAVCENVFKFASRLRLGARATEAEEQKRAIHRQGEQLVQARKRLEAPVITSVYRQRCGRCENILNDVQPPRGRLQRQTTQAARWWFPAGGLLGAIQIRLTGRPVTTHAIRRESSFSIVSMTFHA